MPRLSIADLQSIKEKHKSEFTLREGGYRAKVTIHMGTCGIASGAREVMYALVDELATSGLKTVIVMASGCAGFCSKEPMATVELLNEAPVKYQLIDREKIKRIFKEHIMEGKIVEDYALVVGNETSY